MSSSLRVSVSLAPAGALLALLLGACTGPGPAPTGTPVAQSGGETTSLPKRVIWTDGHHAMRLTSAGTAQCAPTSSGVVRQGLTQTNALRASAGLSPLRLNAKLQRAAEIHSCDMATRGEMTHKGSHSSGPAARVKAQGYHPQITAENIAAGAASVFDTEGVLAQWSASPGHRANIMIPQMKDFGIAAASSADGKVVYWTEVFSDPR